jgi:hypothetical protein
LSWSTELCTHTALSDFFFYLSNIHEAITFCPQHDAEGILEETLSDTENSLFDSDDNSSVTEDFPIHEATVTEGSENEDSDSAQDSKSALHSGASVPAFISEDRANYVRRREQLIGNSGPQNELKNVTEGVDVFKIFSHRN